MSKWVCRYFVFFVLRCSDHLSHILMGSTQTISKEQLPLESSAEEGLNLIKEWLRPAKSCTEQTSQTLCKHDFCIVRRAVVPRWGLTLPWKAGVSARCSVPCLSARGAFCHMSKCRVFQCLCKLFPICLIFLTSGILWRVSQQFYFWTYKGKISLFSPLWRK